VTFLPKLLTLLVVPAVGIFVIVILFSVFNDDGGAGKPARKPASAASQTEQTEGVATAPGDEGAASPKVVKGPFKIIDTDLVEVAGRRIKLHGIQGVGGPWPREFRLLLAQEGLQDREAECQRMDDTSYRCIVGDFDLAVIAIWNGAARAMPGAPADYLRNQADAQGQRKGIWK
jgi:endonuclease YncB( thermonuclease family)